MPQVVRDPAGGHRHDGQPARHRFQHHETERLGDRGEHEGIAVGVQVGQAAPPVQDAEEGDAGQCDRAELVLPGAGAGDHQMDHAPREVVARDADGLDYLVGSLLCHEASDVEKGEPAPHAERGAQFGAAAPGVEGLGVHPASPHLHVRHAEPDQVTAGDAGRGVDPPAPAVEPADPPKSVW